MDFIFRLGSNADKIFSYDDFLDELHKYGKFGLAEASIMLPLMTSVRNATPDLDDTAEHKKDKTDALCFVSDKSRDAFIKRMRDVFVDMQRLRYI